MRAAAQRFMRMHPEVLRSLADMAKLDNTPRKNANEHLGQVCNGIGIDT